MAWAFLALLLIALDIITKLLAVSGAFGLKASMNTGIAFSIPAPNALIIALTPLLLTAAAYLITRYCDMRHRAARGALTLFIAGGIGNFISRVAYGAVIDFIDFKIWPSFNLADSYLTVGAFLLIIFYGKITRDGTK